MTNASPAPSSKSLVLLSGGLDSSYGFWVEVQRQTVALAVTFDYGQRAVQPEIAAAAALCARAEIEHLIVRLPFFSLFSQSSLTDVRQPLPLRENVEIENLERSRVTMKSVWVPNRNGILLNIAAGIAEGRGLGRLVPGFNLEEASTFPDNSEAYIEALNHSFSLSTLHQVKVECHSTQMTKSEIARAALGAGLPLASLWPCYQAGPKWCGECESCQRSRRAFSEAGVPPEVLPWQGGGL